MNLRTLARNEQQWFVKGICKSYFIVDVWPIVSEIRHDKLSQGDATFYFLGYWARELNIVDSLRIESQSLQNTLYCSVYVLGRKIVPRHSHNDERIPWLERTP